MKDAVQSFLRFYRENRDLIMMLTNQPAAERKNAENPPQAEEAEKKENRPQERVGSVSILEEFLKKSAV